MPNTSKVLGIFNFGIFQQIQESIKYDSIYNSDYYFNRKKVLSSKYKGYLNNLQDIRNNADYRIGFVFIILYFDQFNRGIIMRDYQYLVWKEGKYYVSQCINVNVSSFGETIDEAVENLKEAVELYFDNEDVNYLHIDQIILGRETVNV